MKPNTEQKSKPLRQDSPKWQLRWRAYVLPPLKPQYSQDSILNYYHVLVYRQLLYEGQDIQPRANTRENHRQWLFLRHHKYALGF